MISVLDVCCGERSMWFDKRNPCSIYMDIRQESTTVRDIYKPSGLRHLVVAPDVRASYAELPFKDESFSLVAFDPPHIDKCSASSRLAFRYGRLVGDWETEIEAGFAECWRVLKRGGTLVFKWSEVRVPLSRIEPFFPDKPMFGHRSGRLSKTHWICFLKVGNI